ncbi:hypothetical protein V1477_018351, partial [Vespula maculifrons]
MDKEIDYVPLKYHEWTGEWSERVIVIKSVSEHRLELNRMNEDRNKRVREALLSQRQGATPIRDSSQFFVCDH